MDQSYRILIIQINEIEITAEEQVLENYDHLLHAYVER